VFLGVKFNIDFSSAILSDVVFSFLNSPNNVLPLALHTQQCQGVSPLELGDKFISNFCL
jgi:hypothetical protein